MAVRGVRIVVLALVALGVQYFAVSDPSGQWPWLVLLTSFSVFALYVHLYSTRWLRSLDTPLRALSGQAIPWEAEESVGRLRGLGFGIPVWWEAGGAAVGVVRSNDGFTSAWVPSASEERGPILATAWDDARLSTSNGRSVPVEPNDYVQNLRDADIEEMVETHEEAVRLLGKVYGSPIHRTELRLEQANQARLKKRDSLSGRRYRQVVTVMLPGFFAGSLAQRLSVIATPWKLGLNIGAAILLWSFAIMVWVWYFTDRIESWTLPLAMTVLFGAISFSDIQRMNHWRRFL